MELLVYVNLKHNVIFLYNIVTQGCVKSKKEKEKLFVFLRL
jgi:hypothetical protein